MAEKRKKISIRKLIYNDKYLIVCSIIAAVIIWVAVALNLSPMTTKKITVPVDINFSGTLAEQLGITYYGDDKISVEVTISCKKYLAKDITADDITASLKTNSVTSTGYHSVPISISTKEDAEFTVDSYYPTSAEGFYDVAQEVSIPIELNYKNQNFAAEGYVSGEATLNESNAVVKGPSTYVSTVKKVVAEIDLENNLKESQVITLEPVAVDENGRRVEFVTISGKEQGFVATVPILKIQNLPPSISFINAPQNVEDFVKVEYSVNSLNVGVLESADTTSLPLGRIDFSKVNKGKNEFVFDVSKISGISVLDGTTEVVVTVTVPDNFESKTIDISRSDINLDAVDNYRVRILNLSSYHITLIGDKNELDKINKSNLSLTIAPVDGGKFTMDSSECNLIINIKDANKCWVYGQYTAKVRVSEKQK